MDDDHETNLLSLPPCESNHGRLWISILWNKTEVTFSVPTGLEQRQINPQRLGICVKISTEVFALFYSCDLECNSWSFKLISKFDISLIQTADFSSIHHHGKFEGHWSVNIKSKSVWLCRVNARSGWLALAYCDWLQEQVWSATFISVWQYAQLSKQIHPSDTLQVAGC